jgi:UPF0489 domain
MSLEILLNKGRGTSTSCHLNYVAKTENVFIIDNHLAAIWCWEKLDTNQQYNLLHIDMHYDLGHVPINYELYLDLDLRDIAIENLTKFRVVSRGSEKTYLFLWDNYIHLIAAKFPTLFEQSIFVTQQQGSYSPAFDNSEAHEIWRLDSTWANFPSQNKWILNLDIDFFFVYHEQSNTYKQMFHTDFVRDLGKWIVKNRNRFAQIIIALSPECCGGWDNAVDIANVLLEPMEINIKI